MNLTYDAETDTLTILLRDGGARLSEEARPGVVLDFDADDHLLAIEIQDASRHVDRVDTVQLNVRPKPSISTAAE